ncbi:MAG: methyltransferase domain-containing protein [Pseudomonadales bacterium]
MTDVNQQQIEYWNGKAGHTWAQAQQRLDTMLSPISAALVQAAEIQPGMRVVDVGCGCGDTSVALAAAGAAVWGIDISEPMLAVAKSRAAGVKNLAFTRTDAATQAFTPDHDLLFSRFGVMFFAEPSAAFSNLRSALKPRGRLQFACWQPPRLNPWMAIAGKAVQPFLTEPGGEVDPRAPGPFAFADPDYVRGILAQSGFADIRFEALTPTLHLADTLEDGVRFLQEVGPLSRVIGELDDQAREQALAAARAALAGHLTDAGLDLGAACWLVSARAG